MIRRYAAKLSLLFSEISYLSKKGKHAPFFSFLAILSLRNRATTLEQFHVFLGQVKAMIRVLVSKFVYPLDSTTWSRQASFNGCSDIFQFFRARSGLVEITVLHLKALVFYLLSSTRDKGQG